MDGEGPQTLCDLCLAQVCGRLDALCRKGADGSMSLIWAPLFPQELADQLLQEMATKGMLNDTTVRIFQNSEKLRLRRASIRKCKVSAKAFRLALCPHRLLELDASWVPGGLTGADIISGLTLNNIAEVAELQPDLMDEDLVAHIPSLLQDSQKVVWVRYFAGGILAQLASRAEAWTLDQALWSTVPEQLHESIITWPHLEENMVYYSAFRPLCSLLQTCQLSGVQLWAAWTIQLVCRQIASFYIRMLIEEGLVELLEALEHF